MSVDIKNEFSEKTLIERPSFADLNMAYAFSLAKRSTCKRLKVGTVITTLDHRKMLAMGYNGTASGLEHNCRADEPGNCGCLHSEDNAVVNCDTSRQVEKLVYVTHSPCEMCAKRFINMGGVKIVYYGTKYRSTVGIDILQKAGITIVQLDTPLVSLAEVKSKFENPLGLF